MQGQQIRRSSGAKAVALDTRAMLVRYRLLQVMALLLSVTFALGLHLIFGR